MKSYLKTKDYSISGETFNLLYDDKLDMLVTHPRPDDLEVYYESDEYISHTDSRKTFTDKIYQLVKRYSLSRKIAWINKYGSENKTLLDVGAGTGDFLLSAKNDGWRAIGIEPNRDARMRAREKKMELLSAMEALPGAKYQVITLWHVLEHLPDLENQILKLIWHLEDSGTLIIAVPNFKSLDATHYQEFWAAYDVPRHLWHFSKTSIETLFSKHGLKLIKTKAMIFDAFYVSLLSEKYSTGKQNFLKAFWFGMCSNISAWRTKEYSSLVYILQKAQK